MRHNRLFKAIAAGVAGVFLVNTTFQGTSYAYDGPKYTHQNLNLDSPFQGDEIKGANPDFTEEELHKARRIVEAARGERTIEAGSKLIISGATLTPRGKRPQASIQHVELHKDDVVKLTAIAQADAKELQGMNLAVRQRLDEKRGQSVEELFKDLTGRSDVYAYVALILDHKDEVAFSMAEEPGGEAGAGQVGGPEAAPGVTVVTILGDEFAQQLQDGAVEAVYTSDQPIDLDQVGGVVLVLAGGVARRFGALKVIVPVAGLPLATYATDLKTQGLVSHAIVIRGHEKETVMRTLDEADAPVDAYITQRDPAAGTADAAMQIAQIDGLSEAAGFVLVLGGDNCIRPDIRQRLIETHQKEGNAVTSLTIEAPDRPGLGRIIRNNDGSLERIVEERDAQTALAAGTQVMFARSDGTQMSPQEVLDTTERNRSVYVISGQHMLALLSQIDNENAQGQFYLTDIVELARDQGLNVGSVRLNPAANPDEANAALDINYPNDYANAAKVLATDERWIGSSARLTALKGEFDSTIVNLTRPDSGDQEAQQLREFLASRHQDEIIYFVDIAASRWFGAEVSAAERRANELRLEKFLAASNEEAIGHFVTLIEADRGGESIGPWRVPAKDWDSPGAKKMLDKLKPGTLICVSVERDAEHKKIPYYMPNTLKGVKNWFEQERMRRMAQVAIQRSLGRKVVVDVGIGFVGTAELLVGSSAKKEVAAPEYAAELKFRPPLSGDAHPVFSIGYELLGGGTYKQDMIDRGMVGLRADDPTVKPTAQEGYERGNLAGTFLSEILSVSDVSLLSIPQHPYRTMRGHAESIFADPADGLGVVEMAANLMPPGAMCVVESTVFPLYMELFAIPVFKEALMRRRVSTLFSEARFRQIASENELSIEGIDFEKITVGGLAEKLDLDFERMDEIFGLPVLAYSFQRLEPGVEWLESNRRQTRMGGATTARGRELLGQYFEILGYKYTTTNMIVLAEMEKDSENAVRYQDIATTAPVQEIFEALGLDIYGVTREIVKDMVEERVAGKENQGAILSSIGALKNASQRAREYANEKYADGKGEWTKQQYDVFMTQVHEVFSQSTAAITTQAVLYPGGYCVIEQIGHLIYGMIATGLATELDVKVMFWPALSTISYMRMRQRDIAGWIVSELAERGIDPADASIWAGGVTYMPQIEDARNGALELLMRDLADMGVTDWTVFEPYASSWPQVQSTQVTSPFSPENEGYGKVNQTWLPGLKYLFGQKVVSEGKISTEDVYEHIDPHTSFSPEQDVIILSMDHPQLMGRHQPPLRRTDGKGKEHPGLDAVKVAARMMGREGKIILDTHYFLSDEDIKEFLALGFEVRALGRGNVDQLRQDLEEDTKENRAYKLGVAKRLGKELKALRGQEGVDKNQLEAAIKTANAKVAYLAHKPGIEVETRQSYETARKEQEDGYAKAISPEKTDEVIARLVVSEVEPAVDRLESQTRELSVLADSLASQIVQDNAARPTDPHELLRHIQRVSYLTDLFKGFLEDCGLAANDLFVSEGTQELAANEDLAGLFPELPPELAVELEGLKDLDAVMKVFTEAMKGQRQGINTSFQRSAETVPGVHMGRGDKPGSMAGQIYSDRPYTHAVVSEQPGAVADPELVEAQRKFVRWFLAKKVARGEMTWLEAKSRIFSYEANIRATEGRRDEVAQAVLLELAGLGITTENANIYVSGWFGPIATPKDRAAIEQLAQSLRENGCQNVATPTQPGERPAQGHSPDQNTIVLTAEEDFTKDMDIIELASRSMGREGNLIFDANNALTNVQIMKLLALDWRVAGIGRSDIYGRKVKDIKGNEAYLPGLMDNVTDQNRLDAARELLEKLGTMQGQPGVDEQRRQDAAAKTRAKIAYLDAKLKAQAAPEDDVLRKSAERQEIAYRRMLNEQEKAYSMPFERRNVGVALEHLTQSVVLSLERELFDVLHRTARVSGALSEQLARGRCKYPEDTRDLQSRMQGLTYFIDRADNALVDASRAGDALFSDEGQLALRDEVDRRKREARGGRLVLPEGKPPQYYEDQLHHNVPLTPALIQKERERLGIRRYIAAEEARKRAGKRHRDFEEDPITDEEREELGERLARRVAKKDAVASLRESFWHRFTAAGDVEVLPAVRIHPNEEGKLEVRADPEGNLTFTSLRYSLDAEKGKKNNPVDWVKYSCLVPLYVVDVMPEIPEEKEKRAFDWFWTQELMRSSIPWQTKQWLATEVLGKGKILTTIRTEDAQRCEELAILMQGNPYADVGSEKEAGGSGRAGFLVSLEGDRPEVVVTADDRGRERAIEVKGIGPMFGERTPDKISQMLRTIAGGVVGKRVGMTTLAQLYGLVRGPAVGELIRLYDQGLYKELTAPSGVAAFVAHALPWGAPDDLVGQIWRTVGSSDRGGFEFAGGEGDYDVEALVRNYLGFGAAEMLAHIGDSSNVHIAHGLDNSRTLAVRATPRTTKEGESYVQAKARAGERAEVERGYPTDEDSFVNLADERDPFAAFEYYFNWTLSFVLYGYDMAKGGRLENPDYRYFPAFLDAFVERLVEAPIIRNNRAAVERFDGIRKRCLEVAQMPEGDQKRAGFEEVIGALTTEIRDSYITYRALSLRTEYGYNAKADSVYTANVGRNFRRGRLTGKGPSRLTGKGDVKPAAVDEAREFIAAERRLLESAERAMEKGGYPTILVDSVPFDFEKARKELDEKEKEIDELAADEKVALNRLFNVLGWGSFIQKTGRFSRQNISQERQRLADLAIEGRVEEAVEGIMEQGQAYPQLVQFGLTFRDFTTEPITEQERAQIAQHTSDQEREAILKGISASDALESLVERAYMDFVSLGAEMPALGLLEELPSYEPIYELRYYAPRAEVHRAEVFQEDTFKAYPRVGEATVRARELFDKQKAQMAVAQARLGKIKRALTEEGEEVGLETFEVGGALKRQVAGEIRNIPITALVKRNPTSRKVFICHHGLVGAAAHRTAEILAGEVLDRASLVTYTSSRYSPRIPGEKLTPGVMNRMFGKKGTSRAKRFRQECDDLREVIRGTIEFFESKGIPRDQLDITLVGTSLGGQVVTQVAKDFDEVKAVMSMVASPETFSRTMPRQDWHERVTTPGEAQMGTNLARFAEKDPENRIVMVKAERDLPERNKSIDRWEDYAPGRIEYRTFRDGHELGSEESAEEIKQIASNIVGDDWRWPQPAQPATTTALASAVTTTTSAGVTATAKGKVGTTTAGSTAPGSPEKVYDALLGYAPNTLRTSAQIAGRVDRAPATISRDLSVLVNLGLVHREGAGDAARYRVKPEARIFVRDIAAELAKLGSRSTAEDAEAKIGSQIRAILRLTGNAEDWDIRADGAKVHKQATIDPGCTIEGPDTIICAGAIIKDGSMVSNAVIMPGARLVKSRVRTIDDKERWEYKEKSDLFVESQMPARVDEGAELTDSVVYNSRIRKNTKMVESIAEHSDVGEDNYYKWAKLSLAKTKQDVRATWAELSEGIFGFGFRYDGIEQGGPAYFEGIYSNRVAVADIAAKALAGLAAGKQDLSQLSEEDVTELISDPERLQRFLAQVQYSSIEGVPHVSRYTLKTIYSVFTGRAHPEGDTIERIEGRPGEQKSRHSRIVSGPTIATAFADIAPRRETPPGRPDPRRPKSLLERLDFTNLSEFSLAMAPIVHGQLRPGAESHGLSPSRINHMHTFTHCPWLVFEMMEDIAAYLPDSEKARFDDLPVKAMKTGFLMTLFDLNEVRKKIAGLEGKATRSEEEARQLASLRRYERNLVDSLPKYVRNLQANARFGIWTFNNGRKHESWEHAGGGIWRNSKKDLAELSMDEGYRQRRRQSILGPKDMKRKPHRPKKVFTNEDFDLIAGRKELDGKPRVSKSPTAKIGENVHFYGRGTVTIRGNVKLDNVVIVADGSVVIDENADLSMMKIEASAGEKVRIGKNTRLDYTNISDSSVGAGTKGYYLRIAKDSRIGEDNELNPFADIENSKTAAQCIIGHRMRHSNIEGRGFISRHLATNAEYLHTPRTIIEVDGKVLELATPMNIGAGAGFFGEEGSPVTLEGGNFIGSNSEFESGVRVGFGCFVLGKVPKSKRLLPFTFYDSETETEELGRMLDEEFADVNFRTTIYRGKLYSDAENRWAGDYYIPLGIAELDEELAGEIEAKRAGGQTDHTPRQLREGIRRLSAARADGRWEMESHEFVRGKWRYRKNKGDWKWAEDSAAVSQRTAGATESKRTIDEWMQALANYETSGLREYLAGRYGDDGEKIETKVQEYLTALRQARESGIYDLNKPVVVAVAPGRVRVFGGHPDLPGLMVDSVNMAVEEEVVMVVQRTDDNNVVLRSADPNRADKEFRINQRGVRATRKIESPSEWDTWAAHQVTQGLVPTDRAQDWDMFARAIIAFYQGKYYGERDFSGLRVFVGETNLPVGGFSSSSAVVMGLNYAIDVLFGLNQSIDELIYNGYSERTYCGTGGGIGDHAVIAYGRRGEIVDMRSSPEEPLGEPISFPEGLSMLMFESGISREMDMRQVSEKFRRGEFRSARGDSNEVARRGGSGCALASLWVRHHFPEYEAGMTQFERQVKQLPDEGVVGLLRALLRGGESPVSDKRLFEIIRAIPQRVTREELETKLPEFSDQLESLFGTHTRPEGGYRLRDYALYGLSEGERVRHFVEACRAGDIDKIMELQRRGHDGDRVARYQITLDDNLDVAGVQAATFDPSLNDAELEGIIGSANAEGQTEQALWKYAGTLERSLEPLDYFCDLVDAWSRKTGIKAAARISAAGLGGKIGVFCENRGIERLRDFLKRNYYDKLDELGDLVPMAGNIDYAFDESRSVSRHNPGEGTSVVALARHPLEDVAPSITDGGVGIEDMLERGNVEAVVEQALIRATSRPKEYEGDREELNDIIATSKEPTMRQRAALARALILARNPKITSLLRKEDEESLRAFEGLMKDSKVTGIVTGKIGLIVSASFIVDTPGIREILQQLADAETEFVIVVDATTEEEQRAVERLNLPGIVVIVKQGLDTKLAQRIENLVKLLKRKGVTMRQHIGLIGAPVPQAEMAQTVKRLETATNEIRIRVPQAATKGQLISANRVFHDCIEAIAHPERPRVSAVLPAIEQPSVELQQIYEQYREAMETLGRMA